MTCLLQLARYVFASSFATLFSGRTAKSVLLFAERHNFKGLLQYPYSVDRFRSLLALSPPANCLRTSEKLVASHFVALQELLNAFSDLMSFLKREGSQQVCVIVQCLAANSHLAFSDSGAVQKA